MNGRRMGRNRRDCSAHLAVMLCAAACLPVSAASPPASVTDEAAAEELLGIAGEGFRIRETEHFIIAYATQYDVLRPLVGRLEGTFDSVLRFCAEIGLPASPPDARLWILLFDDAGAFKRFAADMGSAGVSTDGLYWPEKNFAVFLNTLRRPEVVQITKQIEAAAAEARKPKTKPRTARAARKRKNMIRRNATLLSHQREIIVERFNRFVLQHEAAHQILFNLGVHPRDRENPRWLVEGLACQFEVPQTGKAGATRQINQMRLGDFREALGVAAGARTITEAAYKAALDSGRVVPLDVFLTDQNAFMRSGSNIGYRYAQAWAFVYYLSRERRKAFGSYIRSLATRPKGKPLTTKLLADIFAEAVGPSGRATELEWIEYMLRLKFKPGDAGR